MFGRRRERMTHGRLARSEFGEGLDHFKRATAHAMGGVGETVGPRVVAVRRYIRPSILVPVAALIKSGGRQAQQTQKARAMRMMRLNKHSDSKKSGRRWSKWAGLLAAGAAVGMAGAAVRRRRAKQWTEYDAEHAFDVVHSPTSSSEGTVKASVGTAMDAAARGVDKATGTATSAVDKGGEKLSSGLGAAQEKVESGTETAKRQAERTGQKAEDLITRAGPPSRNSHS